MVNRWQVTPVFYCGGLNNAMNTMAYGEILPQRSRRYLYKKVDYENREGTIVMKTTIKPLFVAANDQSLEELAWQALWENNTEKSERYYREVLESRSFMKKIWPFGAELNTQMAFLYLRKEDFKEAAKYYGKAAGPWGFSFINDLSARQKQLEMFTNFQPYVISGKSIAKIDFIKSDPLPVIKASIDGLPELNFILDTGGEDIYLDDDMAKKMGIQIAGSAKVAKGFAAGSGSDIGYGKINKVKIGDIVVENIPVSISDMSNISEKVFSGFQIDGIIGTRFLMHFISTIDYKNEKLILRRSTRENRKKFQDKLKNGKYKEIPFILVATHLILADGSFNGKNTGKYFIDTGLAGAGILSSEKRMEDSGVKINWDDSITGAGVGGDAEGLRVLIEEVALGTGDNIIVKNNVPGVILKEELAMFDGQLGVDVSGLISHDFFKGSALTLDFETMLLIIED